jgi:tRNA A37 threonylcarbamoyladenosine dehydratase
MTYRIDPSAVGDGTRLARYEREATLVLVGCGGTGGFLAEALCRLLIGKAARLDLVDPDRVEPHNVARQCFLCGMEIACKYANLRNVATTCVVS